LVEESKEFDQNDQDHRPNKQKLEDIETVCVWNQEFVDLDFDFYHVADNLAK
jgi:hypothetical protein